MFMVPLDNPALKRTIRPLYAQHQATTWAGFLDPNWDRSFDIYPGSVMARVGDTLTPYTGAAGQSPFGLSAFFVSPALGVDEVRNSGGNMYTAWVGGPDSEFEILAPAFDQTADWTVPTDGSVKLLTGNATGLLTPAGATAANAIAELIAAPTTDKIRIRFRQPTPAAGV